MKAELKAKYDIQDLLPIGMTLIVFGIGIAYGLSVLEDVEDDFGPGACNTGYTYNTSSNTCYNASNTSQANVNPDTASFNATGDAITGVAKMPEKLPLIVTVIVAAVVIGILVRYLFVRFVR